MYESIEGSPPEEGDRRRGDDRVFRRRRLAASVAVLAALGLAARAGVVRATCPCHNCCHHGDSYITWGGLYRALARGVWSPLISDAGASQPHPWVGDAQNSGNDYQLGTGTNCVDPLAAPVLGGVDVVAYWSADDERANATYGARARSPSHSQGPPDPRARPTRPPAAREAPR